MSFSLGGVMDAHDKEKNKALNGMIKKSFRLSISLKNINWYHGFNVAPLYEKKILQVKSKKHREKMSQ